MIEFLRAKKSIDEDIDFLIKELDTVETDRQISDIIQFKDINIKLPYSIITESYRGDFKCLNQVSPQLFWIECADTGKRLCSCRVIKDSNYELERLEFSNGISTILSGGVDAVHLMWTMISSIEYKCKNFKMLGAHNPKYDFNRFSNKIDRYFAFNLAFSYPLLFDYSSIENYDKDIHNDFRFTKRKRKKCACGITSFCRHISGKGPSCDIIHNRCNSGKCEK